MEVLECIKTILSGGWQFFVKTKVPGLGFSYGMLLVTLALIPVGFNFLSIALGFNVGHLSSDTYGTRSSKNAKISDARKNDTR